MDVSHLHLHVRDRVRSEAFYTRWFGLRRTGGRDITFLAGDRDFSLALAEDAQPGAMPAWFHFGFRLATAPDVRALCAAMRDAGVTIVKALYDDPTITSFRCADPDGYPIEIYWEED